MFPDVTPRYAPDLDERGQPLSRGAGDERALLGVAEQLGGPAGEAAVAYLLPAPVARDVDPDRAALVVSAGPLAGRVLVDGYPVGQRRYGGEHRVAHPLAQGREAEHGPLDGRPPVRQQVAER